MRQARRTEQRGLLRKRGVQKRHVRPSGDPEKTSGRRAETERNDEGDAERKIRVSVRQGILIALDICLNFKHFRNYCHMGREIKFLLPVQLQPETREYREGPTLFRQKIPGHKIFGCCLIVS